MRFSSALQLLCPHPTTILPPSSSTLQLFWIGASQIPTLPPTPPQPLAPDHQPTHSVSSLFAQGEAPSACLGAPPCPLHSRILLAELIFATRPFPPMNLQTLLPLSLSHHELFRVSSVVMSISLFLHGLSNWTLSPALPKASCWREVLALTDIPSSPEVHSLSHCNSVPSCKHPCVLDASCPGKLFFHILPLAR